MSPIIATVSSTLYCVIPLTGLRIFFICSSAWRLLTTCFCCSMVSTVSSNTLSKSETDVSTLWMTETSLKEPDGEGKTDTEGVDDITDGLVWDVDNKSNLCKDDDWCLSKTRMRPGLVLKLSWALSLLNLPTAEDNSNADLSCWNGVTSFVDVEVELECKFWFL